MYESAICILGYLCSLKQQMGQLCQNFSLVQKNVCDLIWSFKSFVHWRLKYNEVLNRCFPKKSISVSNNSKIPNNFVFLHWVPKRWNKDHNQTSVKNSRGFKRVGERRGGSHQWGSVARRLGQMPSILLQGDNNQLPLLQGDTAHTNFFYFSFKGTHTNYLYYSFKGTHRAHTLTFSTSLQWGTHQTTSTSTILPILILLLLLFLSL